MRCANAAGTGEECSCVQKDSKIAREEGSVGAYGWTGRRTARVAHKRAGRRLRLQGDLEHLPTLQRPLRSLRAPAEALRWRHKATHLVRAWPLHLDALNHAVPPTDALAAANASASESASEGATAKQQTPPARPRSSRRAGQVGRSSRCGDPGSAGRSASWQGSSLECLVRSASARFAPLKLLKPAPTHAADASGPACAHRACWRRDDDCLILPCANLPHRKQSWRCSAHRWQDQDRREVNRAALLAMR
ncbi:hypothetical protein EJ07DRAFT_155215 [Lizonia empirigonia]|nr:hypothetical protein EJ07DRAFT_155215 [Lizonia empirigonia]